MSAPVCLDAETSKWIKPEDELADLELGERVNWFFFVYEIEQHYVDPRPIPPGVFAPWGASHKRIQLTADEVVEASA